MPQASRKPTKRKCINQCEFYLSMPLKPFKKLEILLKDNKRILSVHLEIAILWLQNNLNLILGYGRFDTKWNTVKLDLTESSRPMELNPTGTMLVIRNPFITLSGALAGKCPWLLQCSHFLPECCSVELSGFHISKHSVRETEMEFLILGQILYALKEKLFSIVLQLVPKISWKRKC